jgi:outer membrane lipoprotein-sorting protein
MEMPMVMFMKNPNKIKVTYSFNGQDIVSVFDGEKGYMINPMMGSSDPVELTGDQLKQVQNNSAFSNELLNYFKNGQLTLEGQENVNDKPAFKLKVNEGTSPVYMFLDKESYLLVKTSTTVDQMGTSTNVDSYMTDYVDIDGVVMPKKTTAMANGMEAAVITFDKIEVNIPMDDSVFKIK